MPSIQKLTNEDPEKSFQVLDDVLSRLDSDNFNLPWIGYNPAIASTGSMDFDSPLLVTSRYLKTDRTVNIFVQVSGTVSGTPNGILTVTLPFRPRSLQTPIFNCIVNDNGSDVAGIAKTSSPQSNIVHVSRYDSASYTAGTVEFYISGTYEVER